MPHSIILASCKPGFRLAWACRKHVASRSKACRKQVESQLQTCLKPSYDRTSRLMQQVRDQIFDKKVESVSKACRKPARTCRKPGCKPGRKIGLQLARIMECGLDCHGVSFTVGYYIDPASAGRVLFLVACVVLLYHVFKKITRIFISWTREYNTTFFANKPISL